MAYPQSRIAATIRPSVVRQPHAPEPRRIYAIGDIHGCRDLLDRMIEEIRGDLAACPVDRALTVTLGDYVDRGPDSRGVVERLAGNPFPTGYVALKGNHEDMLVRFLQDPSVGEIWSRNGGLETLRSYGIDVGPMMRGRRYGPTAALFEKALPPAHAAFFASLRVCLSLGRYFFCHAGVRPGVPFTEQREHDLLWIRDEFLCHRADFGKIVVHGHTPSPVPELRPNRINVDTGAFMTGRLTCVVLEAERPRFLSVP
jgi:serine/threonine protein phosphatase 1